MKVLISDYPDVLASRDLQYEEKILKKSLPKVEVVLLPYVSKRKFEKELKNSDALITAFLPITKEVLLKARCLKCISVNATGFNTIDLKAAEEQQIAVIPLVDYCTQEVADHTMGLILALSRRFKAYQSLVEREHIWKYKAVGPIHRMSQQTLAVYGFGKIGRAVAIRAKSFGMEVVAVDKMMSADVEKQYGIKFVDTEFVQKNATIITTHMNATTENTSFFDQAFFSKLRKNPIFINVSRGISMNEKDLAAALDKGLISGAGLDVLESEHPVLEGHDLIGRENVLITPHAAFYSEESLNDLQRISCENVIEHLLK